MAGEGGEGGVWGGGEVRVGGCAVRSARLGTAVRGTQYAVASGDLSNNAVVERAPSITAHGAPRTLLLHRALRTAYVPKTSKADELVLAGFR